MYSYSVLVVAGRVRSNSVQVSLAFRHRAALWLIPKFRLPLFRFLLWKPGPSIHFLTIDYYMLPGKYCLNAKTWMDRSAESLIIERIASAVQLEGSWLNNLLLTQRIRFLFLFFSFLTKSSEGVQAVS